MKYLQTNELKKLLDTTRNSGDHNSLRDWTILVLAYRHAMRAEEISELSLKDVDLKSNTIRIRRVKGSLESIQPIEAAPGGQPWLNERKALRLYLEQRDGKKVDPSGFVFVSQKGGKLTTNALWRMFQVRAEAAGIQDRSLHSLKHTRASLMLQGGATVTETAMTCGHRALSSTMRYLHTTPEQAAIAARKAEANVF
jgi:site-specific recombinase XerD